MPHLPYAQLIDIKRWADAGLYEAAQRNFDQLNEQDAGLMLLIFDHIHTVDRIFQHHLQGLPHNFKSGTIGSAAGIRDAGKSARDVDEWYACYVRGLAAGDFDQALDFAFTSGKPARMTRGEILLHVCLHGTYHRGNAGALLQLRGLTPSRDAITDFLEDAA